MQYDYETLFDYVEDPDLLQHNEAFSFEELLHIRSCLIQDMANIPLIEANFRKSVISKLDSTINDCFPCSGEA